VTSITDWQFLSFCADRQTDRQTNTWDTSKPIPASLSTASVKEIYFKKTHDANREEKLDQIQPTVYP